MRVNTLMKEIHRFAAITLGSDIMQMFTKGVNFGSGKVGQSNPKFNDNITYYDLNMEHFGFAFRKGHLGFGTWSKALPKELITEVLLAAAIAAEEVLGIQEGENIGDGIRIEHEPQVRDDSLRYVNFYFPYSMKEYGPQEQDLRAAAMLNFAKPLMEAIIQSTEREIRKWNLRQRKGV